MTRDVRVFRRRSSAGLRSPGCTNATIKMTAPHWDPSMRTWVCWKTDRFGYPMTLSCRGRRRRPSASIWDRAAMHSLFVVNNALGALIGLYCRVVRGSLGFILLHKILLAQNVLSQKIAKELENQVVRRTREMSRTRCREIDIRSAAAMRRINRTASGGVKERAQQEESTPA